MMVTGARRRALSGNRGALKKRDKVVASRGGGRRRPCNAWSPREDLGGPVRINFLPCHDALPSDFCCRDGCYVAGVAPVSNGLRNQLPNRRKPRSIKDCQKPLCHLRLRPSRSLPPPTRRTGWPIVGAGVGA